MSRLKTSLIITIGVAILVIASESYAVSFNCAEASTLVEKRICSEKRLSDLDDLLEHSYKKAISNITDKNALKTEQRAWIKDSRNKCQSSNCLEEAYKERIEALDTSASQINELKNVVLGRCHMDECWWWKVEKSENIKSESNEKLVKVYFRDATVEFPNGRYPDVFPNSENKRWSKSVSEAFIFCSPKLPAYIEYNKETKKFTGTIPFSQDGSTSGATEGIGNLYSYVCGKQSIFEISPELELSEIFIEKPTEIFKYPNINAQPKGENRISQGDATAPKRLELSKVSDPSGLAKLFFGQVIAIGYGLNMAVDNNLKLLLIGALADETGGNITPEGIRDAYKGATLLSIENGEAVWEGRPLPAALVTVDISTINRTAGKYNHICMKLGGIRDNEFNYLRNPVYIFCDKDKAAAERDVRVWKEQTGFKLSSHY